MALISPAHGASSEAVVLAAMRLSDDSSYSWTSSVEDDARAYVIDGRTSRSGYTSVTLPMVEPIADRLGRDADSQIEALFNSTGKCVIRVGARWKTVGELPKASKRDDNYFVIVPRRID